MTTPLENVNFDEPTQPTLMEEDSDFAPSPVGESPRRPGPSHTAPQLTPYYTGPPASSEVLHLLRYFEDTRRQEEAERRREDAERRRKEQERRREDNERLLTLFTAMSTRHTDVTPQSNVQSVSPPPTPSSGANKGHPRNLNPKAPTFTPLPTSTSATSQQAAPGPTAGTVSLSLAKPPSPRKIQACISVDNTTPSDTPTPVCVHVTYGKTTSRLHMLPDTGADVMIIGEKHMSTLQVSRSSL
ncbi:hypothetical protein Pcinc_013717 [Petrolisthes cinctipes]|uniref:Peptidase A2 domain-containing protein n=1 Tax=Petrolisthes cinctipes TaxID=88211 RepID=A0AAE1FY50_PETCI|nr:hypothetical protein Pcinc_013717 [Petrolisthes cinctipes]